MPPSVAQSLFRIFKGWFGMAGKASWHSPLLISFVLLLLMLVGVAHSQSTESRPKEPIALQQQAVAELSRAIELFDTFGDHAARPGIRRAVDATRRWLDTSGQLTASRSERLTSLARLCTTAGEPCEGRAIRAAILELRLLLDLHRAETAAHRANAEMLQGWLTHYDRALDSAGRAIIAERHHGRAAEILLETMRARALTEAEATLLMSNLAQAADYAYQAGNCTQAERHASKTLDLAPRFRGIHNPNYSPDANALTIQGECALWARDPAKAYRLAQQAIAAENDVPTTRARAIASLDLRGRYVQARAMRAEPREVGAVAALQLWKTADMAHRQALFANIARWTSESRASTLSDAVLLAEQMRSGSPTIRQAIATLIEANSTMDEARRGLDADEAGADMRVDMASAQLADVEAAALQAGVQVPSAAATPEQIRAALAPGQGFLFLYRSQFGAVVWGIAADGDMFVMSPSPEMELKIGRDLGSDLPNVISAAPPARYYAGNSIGWDTRTFNAILARLPRADDVQSLLAVRLTQLGIEFGPMLRDLPGRATYWAIAHDEELDGVPFAQIPLFTRAEAIATKEPIDLSRSLAEKAFGYFTAYSLVPSPRAFIALREARSRTRGRDYLANLRVGDIPFTKEPCGVAQVTSASARGVTLTAALRRRAILDQACIEESKAQLAAFAATGGSQELLTGSTATQGALSRFGGRDIGVLAFSTHGVPAGTALTGDWPALLLYPPADDAGPANDGVLTSLEAAQLRLRAALVVLSACSTGIEDEVLGEEPLAGMARGFFLGGAESVLVTRWDLNARYALQANLAFAEALSRGESRAEAMRSARRKLADENREIRPWHWAVIELLGSGDSL
jgi:hypothetical protein